MGNHERTEPLTHHSSRKPSLLSAIVLAAVVVGVVAGVMGIVSMITHSRPAATSAETTAPFPMTFETPKTVVTETVHAAAPQSVRETTTARVTVTARVTDVRVSAAPTATVTSTPAPAPTVTKYQERCWVWDDSQARYVQSDCRTHEPLETDDESLAHSR